MKAFLIFLAFLICATSFFAAVGVAWRSLNKRTSNKLGVIGLTAFVLLWFLAISSTYVKEAIFLHRLSTLDRSEVASIQIGQHEFRDQETINAIVSALHEARWFAVNHGGWGDSIPLTIHLRSGQDFIIDVARYFRVPAAIISTRRPTGSGFAPSLVFSSKLLPVLSSYGVELPNCDTPHDIPCTASQLNP